MQIKRSFTLPGARGNAVRAEVANYFLNAGYTQTSDIPLRFARSSGKRSKVTVEVSTEAEASTVNATFDVFGPAFLMREQERKYWRDEADRFVSEIGVKMGLPPTVLQPVSDEQRAREDLAGARGLVITGFSIIVGSLAFLLGLVYFGRNDAASSAMVSGILGGLLTSTIGLVKIWRNTVSAKDRLKWAGGSLAVLAVVGVGAFFAYGAIAASQNPWKQFTSQEGAFSVLMPGVPKAETATVNSAAGPLELRVSSLSHERITYAASYVDYPSSVMQGADPNKMLDAVRNTGVSNMQGKLLSELIISIDGNPGRELKIEAVDGKTTVRMRICLVKNRLYQLMTATVKQNSLSSNIIKFLDSFKLTGP